MAATTYTRYLRLRISSGLTADAQYNLNRLDLLGASFVTDLAETVLVRSVADVAIEAESSDIGGAGTGGTIRIGHPSDLTTTILLNGIIDVASALGVKDQASGGSKYLRFRYDSTLDGSVDTAADRLLTFDPQGADRSVILGGDLTLGADLSTAGFALSFTTQQAGSFVLPDQASGTLVSRDSTDTLTNKTIDTDDNDVQNIRDANVAANAAISLSKLAALTASRALASDASGVISATAVTSTELGYLSGVTSSVQAQIDTKLSRAMDNLQVSGWEAAALFIGSSSTAAESLAPGLAGEVLTMYAGAPAWRPSANVADTAPKAYLHDATSSSLPTGTTVDIDGITVSNGDRVLFSSLSTDNNRIYEASGVGVALAWSPAVAFNGDVDPTPGDIAAIVAGTAYGRALGFFDGTSWTFNETVRYFNGADYWEQSSLQTTTLSDAQGSPANVFTVTAENSENWVIDYSITRASGEKETGTLHISVDGTDVSFSQSGAEVGSTGVTFSADVSAGSLRLRYTTTTTGDDATMKWISRRWSDAPGGPGGLPSYTSAIDVPGAGSVTGAVQLRSSTGGITADDDFHYDTTDDSLYLGDLGIETGRSVTLADNQSVATDIFTLDSSSFRHIVVEYGISRSTTYATGRLLIVHDGTTAYITNDAIDVGSHGVSFSAIVSGSNLSLQYTTTSTGSTAALTYSVRKWAS